MWETPALIVQGGALAALIGTVVIAFRLITGGALVPGRWYDRALSERDKAIEALSDTTAAAREHAASVNTLNATVTGLAATVERLAATVERQAAALERMGDTERRAA